jgi:hypothetical protein
VDPLEAFGDDGLDAEQRRCPWRPSRGDEPVPYSLPARIDQRRALGLVAAWPRRRSHILLARRERGWSTPPSVPGAIRFLMRMLAKVPRVITAVVAAAGAVAVEVARRARRATSR